MTATAHAKEHQKLTPLLLLLFLIKRSKKGVGDNELEDLSEKCEKWEHFSTKIVLFGLAIDVFVAWLHANFGTTMEGIGPVISNLVVVLGVLGESKFSAYGSNFQKELRSRADERTAKALEGAALANERAAKLEKEAAEARERTAEIERVTAWRRVSSEQMRIIIAGLSPIAPAIRVFFEYQSGDPEAFMFAHDISRAFSNIIGHTSNSWLGRAIFGASISFGSDIDKSPIVAAFENAGIAIDEEQWPALKMWPILPEQPRPNVLICVYPKAPAEFAVSADTDSENKENPDAKRE